jgi:hypothetical protein
VRRALIIMASASGTPVPAIARLVAADEDTVRGVVHAFDDQFGPLSIRPCHGSSWAPRSRPDRLPATYRRTHGIRYFHGCHSLRDDRLWGTIHTRKGGDHSLAALKSIRAARPGGGPIYVIMDNLSANKTPRSADGPRRTRSSCA